MTISWNTTSIVTRSLRELLLLAIFAPAALFGQVGKADDDAKPENAKLTAPIHVTGRVRTEEGEPISNAKITLVSTNGIDERLAETTTDLEGRYAFREIPLPLRKPGRDQTPSGTLQVFGEAEGFGIAWHGMRFYHPQPRPEEFPKGDQDHSYYQDEPIEMDLTMRPPRTLTGVVFGDDSLPVEKATISLSTLDYLDTEGREHHHNFREFWAMHFAPEHSQEATTGKDGRFEIKNLPNETVVIVRVHHPDFANQMFVAAITEREITEYDYINNGAVTIRNDKQVSLPIREMRAVQTSPLEIHAKSTRRIVVRVVHENDESPVKDIRVVAVSVAKDDAPGQGTSSYGTTDESGRAELKLPPGKFRLVADPPRDSDFVRTYEELVVENEPREQSKELPLKVGAVVIFEAVDAADGSGIPGVNFGEDFEEGRRKGRREVQSSSTYVDHPVTDEKGELRVIAVPGTRNYSVGLSPAPDGYRFDPKSSEKLVQCEAGKTVRVRFTLIKK